MNNANGHALLARIRTGNRVTVRRPNGSMATYRAIVTHTGRALARDARGQEFVITQSNIVRLFP